ncbi:MAG TPA: nucleoside 2-deoxyribosyltransferase [Candidatus Limnocylindrales bacterium]|nr:nucleoside 2-deoxyribosyltransferase [Candidatus Limnocylindrales bacterium]
MKIYFGFTVAGDRSGVETARRVVETLEAMGHEVLTRHLVDDNARAADRGLGAPAVFARDMAWIAECDVFVGEVSGSSFGIGFEAGYLLGAGMKPVILLYRADAAERISLLITGNTHPRCTVHAYGTAEDALAFVERKFAAAEVTIPAAAAK